jgi:acetyl esterase/lipase
VYPGPLGVPETIPDDAPPAFLVVANDDGAANVVLGIAQKYRAAKRPVEAHILSRGGHGFHLGKRSRVAAVQAWPQRLAEWLDDSFILDPTKRAEEERRANEESQRKKKKA